MHFLGCPGGRAEKRIKDLQPGPAPDSTERSTFPAGIYSESHIKSIQKTGEWEEASWGEAKARERLGGGSSGVKRAGSIPSSSRSNSRVS